MRLTIVSFAIAFLILAGFGFSWYSQKVLSDEFQTAKTFAYNIGLNNAEFIGKFNRRNTYINSRFVGFILQESSTEFIGRLQSSMSVEKSERIDVVGNFIDGDGALLSLTYDSGHPTYSQGFKHVIVSTNDGNQLYRIHIYEILEENGYWIRNQQSFKIPIVIVELVKQPSYSLFYQ